MKPLIISGPCSVESEEQILKIAAELKLLGVDALRGGAFKPRTLPETFQGLGEKGLKFLKKASVISGLPIVTEVMDSEEIELVASYTDYLQIGTRNMHNYSFLKRLGQRASDKTIILKRGMCASKKELLGAIRYLEAHGHKGEIIICERGIRTFANGEYDRFTLDVAFIADLKKTTKYRVIVDPSHPAGRSDLVAELAYAGIAAGADGMMVEVKESEEHVPLSDAAQAITIEELAVIIEKVKKIFEIVN